MASLLNQTELDKEQQEYVDAILVSSGANDCSHIVTIATGFVCTNVDDFLTMFTLAEHLLTVINDILDFSKIDSGKMDLSLAPVDVAQCVEQAVDLAFRAEFAELRVLWSVIRTCIDG